MLRAYLKAKRLSRHATNSHMVMCLFFLNIWFVSGYLYCSGRSALAGVLWPVFGWFSGLTVGHDCSHQAFFTRPWMNDLGVLAASPLNFGPSTWTAAHLVGHHTQTNNPAVDGTGDPDLLLHSLPHPLSPLSAYKKLARNHPADAPLQGIEKGVHFVALVMGLFLYTFTLSVLHPVCALLGVTTFGPHVERLHMATGCTRRLVLLNAIHVVATMFCAGSIFRSWGGSLNCWSSFAWGLGCTFFPWAQSSIYFALVGQVSHQQPEAQFAEDALVKTKAEQGGFVSHDAFLRAQVLASTDYSTSSFFWGVVTCSLNMQSLHHALPGVCECHYRDLYPEFEVICRKHSIKMPRRKK